MNNHFDSAMNEGNFSCVECFYDGDELIGHCVRFVQDGVTVNVKLIKLNTKTGKFTTGFIKGNFFSNKVEVTAEKEHIDKEWFTFEAKKGIERFQDKIVLSGSAKITSPQNEIIEANEITIYLE